MPWKFALTKKQLEIDKVFKPKEGVSDWIKADELKETVLKWGNNGRRKRN